MTGRLLPALVCCTISWVVVMTVAIFSQLLSAATEFGCGDDWRSSPSSCLQPQSWALVMTVAVFSQLLSAATEFGCGDDCGRLLSARRQPQSWALVMTGRLLPALSAAIELGSHDDCGCLLPALVCGHRVWLW